MPTEKKIQSVERIKGWLRNATIVIATDPTGMGVSEMTELRRTLRDKGIEYRMVKNRLAHLAADAAGTPWVKEIVEGPTGIVLGYDDASEPARVLDGFIRANRSPLAVKKAAYEGRILSPEQVNTLATLPSRDVLIAQLMGQLNAPIQGLAGVLNGPVGGFARVLQGLADQRAQPQEA
jgi:large subunit ribosomal protein L10